MPLRVILTVFEWLYLSEIDSGFLAACKLYIYYWFSYPSSGLL
jgi:hypothetical protein